MNIKFGDNNSDVKLLQQQLVKLGYNLSDDGDFGQKTLNAINKFQALNGKSLTDVVDDALFDLINQDVDFNNQVDKVSMNRILALHPKVRFEILHIYKHCLKNGVKIRVVQGYRTFEEQEALYQQGRTKPGPIVTNARGGYSNHNYALSIDFCLLHPDGSISWSQIEDADSDGKKDWMEVVDTFKSYGYEAGIEWKFRDPPHLQKTFGYSVKQLLALHDSGKVDKNGFVII